jgi:hypothetical protein
MVNGDCFGYDYSLESRLQCSYTERSGACPDFGLSGDRGSNQVELLDCTKVSWHYKARMDLEQIAIARESRQHSY